MKLGEGEKFSQISFWSGQTSSSAQNIGYDTQTARWAVAWSLGVGDIFGKYATINKHTRIAAHITSLSAVVSQ